MEKLASKLLEQAKDFIIKNPKLVTGLAATGGLGALAGAVSTNTDENDSAKTRLGKRLKNAILLGGLATGAAGLGAYGLHKFENALPVSDVSPLDKSLHSSPVRAIGAGLGFGAGAGIASKAKHKALYQVFRDKMNLDKLVEVLNNPEANPVAIKKIKDLAGSVHEDGTFSEALKNWVNKTGVDTTKLNAFKAENTKAEEAIAGWMDKLKINSAKGKLESAMPRSAEYVNKVNPTNINKLLQSAKRNKLALGLGAAGMLLPEAISGAGSAAGSMFGNSLYE